MTPEQSKQIGTLIVVDGLSERQALSWARGSGMTVAPADVRRAAYEVARDRDPFSAAKYGLGNPAVYSDGRATTHPVEEGLRAATARAVGSPVATALSEAEVFAGARTRAAAPPDPSTAEGQAWAAADAVLKFERDKAGAR